jgi:hypothetical protein
MTTIGSSQQVINSARLLRATSELRSLNQVIKGAELDPRVLHDFREAMDHVRLTSWAAQQWLSERLQGDSGNAMTLLTAERIRRSAQLNYELSEDLSKQAAGYDRQQLEKLFTVVERLYLLLHRLLNKSERVS